MIINNEAAFERALAPSIRSDFVALIRKTRSADVLDVLGSSRWTDAVAIQVLDLALLYSANTRRVATHHCIASVPRNALADHCSDRLGVQDSTLCVNSAGFYLGAGVDAFSVEAGSLGRTLIILLALDVDLVAASFHAARIPWRTGTLNHVVVNAALCLLSAGVLGARVLAAVVDASFVGGTV